MVNDAFTARLRRKYKVLSGFVSWGGKNGDIDPLKR